MKVVKPSGIVDREQWIEALDYLAAVSGYDETLASDPLFLLQLPWCIKCFAVESPGHQFEI